MSRQKKVHHGRLEMADIFRSYGAAYRQKYGQRMLPSHLRAMNDIEKCRTAELGGQVYKCPDHDEMEYSYHSCMNRHCPKCQNDQAQKWLIKERKKLLPVLYFFATFTIPQELRPLARSNQSTIYNIIFRASWLAMQKLAKDPKFLGAKIGCVGVLHTWARSLPFHPHVHYLVPAGGLTDDNSRWISGKEKFFVPVKALSKIYRAIFREMLKKDDPELFSTVPKQVWSKDWVVHIKSAGTGFKVLKYFAPYIFRVAISNNRLIKLQNGQVFFRYKNAETNQWKIMKLPVLEFIRRFLQHVLPRGFKKVRHYGFLSGRNKEVLLRLHYILGTVELKPEEEPTFEPWIPTCPKCGKEMQLFKILEPVHSRASPMSKT